VCRLTGSGSPAAQPPAAQHRRRSQPTADLWCQWLFRSMSDPHLPLHRLAPLKRLSQGSRREPAALRGSPRRRLGGGTRCLLQSEVQVDGAGPQRARGAVQRVERVNPISDTCAYRLGSQPLWASDRGSAYGTTRVALNSTVKCSVDRSAFEDSFALPVCRFTGSTCRADHRRLEVDRDGPTAIGRSPTAPPVTVVPAIRCGG
jgi:hypothetical protein